MSYATHAPAPIRRTRDEPLPFEGIAPILIRIPALERGTGPGAHRGPRRRRLRREVRGALWVMLGIALGWAISTYRSLPVPDPAIDPGPVLVRLSIEAEPSATALADEQARSIALKGFLLPSETR